MLSTTWMRWQPPLCAALLALAGCQTGSAFRDLQARLNPDMGRVVDAYVGLGAKPVSQLPVAAARTQPTLDDAVRQIQQSAAKPAAAPLVRTTETTVPGGAGS